VTTEAFRAFQSAAPFQHFAIHLADGRTLEVRHPELLSFSRAGRTAYVVNADRLTEVLDVLLVVSLRPLPNTPSAVR
jgi:hypothetical protein